MTCSENARRITSQCLMGRTRRLARMLTRIYDEELRPLGVQASQVTSLAVIAANGPMRRSDIGRWLHLDSSTLTRNIRVMLANRWIEEVPERRDGRRHALRVTTRGAELLRELEPRWETAQRRAIELLGVEGQASIMALDERLHEAG